MNDWDEVFDKGMEDSISQPKKIYQLAEKLLLDSIKCNNRHNIAKSYLLMAYSGQFLGLYAESFEYVQKALPVFIENNDLKNQASAYNTLGFIYYYFDDHDKRLEVNVKSLEIRKKINDIGGYLSSLNNTGDTYIKVGKYKEAITLFNECLNFKNHNSRMLAIVHSNMAEALFHEKKYELALEKIEISNKYAKEEILKHVLCDNLYIKSRIHNQHERWEQTIEQLESGLQIINEKDDPTLLKDLYIAAASAYEYLNQPKLALDCLKNHFSLEKIVSDRKQKKEIKSIQFKNEIQYLHHKTSELEVTIEQRTIELKQALEVEKTISHFTQEINDTKTIEEVLFKLVKNCISQLHLEDCVVYLVDDKGEFLIQKAAFGPKSIEGKKISNPIKIKIGAGIVGSVAKYGKYELIIDTSKDPRYIIDDDIRYSELAVPIFYNKKVIGVIDSEHSQKNYFNERHVNLFSMLASIVQSRMEKIKEQQTRQDLQAKIVRINKNLEKQIRIKSKENTQLNHKILEQEKKAIIGEMSAIIAHELNTPLATIKAGNEAILFLLNKMLNSDQIHLISKKEIDYIIQETTNRTCIKEKNRVISKKRNLKFDNPRTIELIEKLNIEDIDQLMSFKNTQLILNVIDEIRTINDFSSAILKSVSRANHVVEELKELSTYEEGHEKQKIDLIQNFEGLKLHMSLNHPETKIEVVNKDKQSIFGNEFRIIQLWSNIMHLIMENCEFSEEPKFNIFTSKTNHTTCIKIDCIPSKINTILFNSEILNCRFMDDIESSIKLKLNIIQTILIEHRAVLKCVIHQDSLLSFTISF